MVTIAKFATGEYSPIQAVLEDCCIERVQLLNADATPEPTCPEFYYLLKDGVRVVQHVAHFTIEAKTREDAEALVAKLRAPLNRVTWQEIKDA